MGGLLRSSDMTSRDASFARCPASTGEASTDQEVLNVFFHHFEPISIFAKGRKLVSPLPQRSACYFRHQMFANAWIERDRGAA